MEFFLCPHFILVMCATSWACYLLHKVLPLFYIRHSIDVQRVSFQDGIALGVHFNPFLPSRDIVRKQMSSQGQFGARYSGATTLEHFRSLDP